MSTEKNTTDSASNPEESAPPSNAEKPQAKGDQLRGGRVGLAQLMAVTAGISFVCAVLATVSRRLPKEQQAKGALFILVMALICLAVVVFFYVYRGYIERQAGPSRFITKAPLTSWYHILGIASCVAVLAIMVIGLVSASRNDGKTFLLQNWFWLYLAWSLVASSSKYLISAFLWKINPKSVDVRTNGLILGFFMFVPWGRFTGFRWNIYSRDLMLLSEGNFLERKVPANQRDSLEQALLDFLPKRQGFS